MSRISYKRSIVKATTWEVGSFMLFLIIGWFITGDIGQLTIFGLVLYAVKIPLFVIHERAWKTTGWLK